MTGPRAPALAFDRRRKEEESVGQVQAGCPTGWWEIKGVWWLLLSQRSTCKSSAEGEKRAWGTNE